MQPINLLTENAMLTVTLLILTVLLTVVNITPQDIDGGTFDNCDLNTSSVGGFL